MIAEKRAFALSPARIIIVFLLALTVLAAFGVYYVNHYGYYRNIAITSLSIPDKSGKMVSFTILDARAIDSKSSPLRFRACLRIAPNEVRDLAQYRAIASPEPRIAPKRFPCFAAQKIGADLEAGKAQAFLVKADIAAGIDRVIAIYPDGRGFMWHRLKKDYKK